MYSLNAPVPTAAARLASDLAADLPAATPRERGEHTLVVKRLGTGDASRYTRLEVLAREALAGTPACEARIDGVGVFEEAASGASPVVYLRVESPGLERLHWRLASTFDPVPGVEGEEYVPHVTVARGGSVEAARRVAGREVDPIEWTVDELVFWDAERGQPTTTVSLLA